MKQRIFSHFQDYLIQYISHQYQDLLYCNSSQYILSTQNSQHNNNNNVLAMTMPYSGQGWRHSAWPEGECTMSSTLTTIFWPCLKQKSNMVICNLMLFSQSGSRFFLFLVFYIFVFVLLLFCWKLKKNRTCLNCHLQ
jgi:hypothetical protein